MSLVQLPNHTAGSDTRELLADIETTRLLLRCLLPEAVRARLAGDRKAVATQLGASVPLDLLREPAVLQHAAARLTEDADYLPWSARAIVLRSSMEMVGHVRFHSRPDPEYLHPYARNAVEFGYVVYPTHRRRGYALEALTGTMRWARDTHHIRRFVASISPSNGPSLALIAKIGFHRIAEHVDPEDGIEHIYLGGDLTSAQ
jgi:[ribosomal protein S5]-alanine N-acetyltransferase